MYALTRPMRLDLETFARGAGMHPDLVRRLVALGLLDVTTDAGGELWFAPPQYALVARMRRLRRTFALNYSSLGLVLDLLDRLAARDRSTRGGSA
jgi:chaperone modulatory protein CbpM